MAFSTPLRYPGGKASLGPWLADVMRANAINGGVYVEPYAGGAGAALYLLTNGHADRIIINDADPAIHAFWWSVLNDTHRFIAKLRRCAITLPAREQHRRILASPNAYTTLEVGFAAFFLNRTNRSGILQGGVIGGKDQSGPYKIDARFNKDELSTRIERIGELRSNIELHGVDALNLVQRLKKTLPKQSLVYFDPPYYQKGAQLYRNFYETKDHEKIAKRVQKLRTPWLVTYDDCPAIASLYEDSSGLSFSLYYSTHASREAKKELMYFGNVSLPCEPYMKRANPGNLRTPTPGKRQALRQREGSAARQRSST
ncbi:DNA adenine methylase [Lysobacter tyrosinilyticus]